MCVGLTRCKHPTRDSNHVVMCLGCRQEFVQGNGFLLLGYIIISKEEWFSIMPFCSTDCILAVHPMLGNC